MHSSLHSSHVARDFSDGQLTIDIVREDAQLCVSRHDRVHFTVPRDYHVHNDSVAAALLTLLGRTCADVTFNFPISKHCAEMLTSYYRLTRVGPVDPALERGQPGRYLAINFSGGADSTALYLLMQEVLGADFKVITCDFGGRFAHERSGFQQLRRDITCRTDLRQHGYDQHGRFITAVPLLYADYLELRSIANGHTLLQENSTIANRAQGQLPNYRQKDAAYLASGLQEEHLVRSLSSLSMFRIIFDCAPELLQAAMTASAPRNTEKYYSRMIWIRYLTRETGVSLPAFLESLPLPTVPWPHIPGQCYSLVSLLALKHVGDTEARHHAQFRRVRSELRARPVARLPGALQHQRHRVAARHAAPGAAQGLPPAWHLSPTPIATGTSWRWCGSRCLSRGRCRSLHRRVLSIDISDEQDQRCRNSRN